MAPRRIPALKVYGELAEIQPNGTGRDRRSLRHEIDVAIKIALLKVSSVPDEVRGNHDDRNRMHHQPFPLRQRRPTLRISQGVKPENREEQDGRFLAEVGETQGSAQQREVPVGLGFRGPKVQHQG